MYLYIVLSYSGSLPSVLIKKASGKMYTHVSLACDLELFHMYSFGRKYLYTPYPGGFVIENVKQGLFEKKKTKISVYRISISAEDVQKFKSIINEFINNDDLYYDFLGALGMYFNKNKFKKNGYVCSSFANEVLHKIGIHTGKNSWQIWPHEFASIAHAELVYEGLASEYSKVLDLN